MSLFDGNHMLTMQKRRACAVDRPERARGIAHAFPRAAEAAPEQVGMAFRRADGVPVVRSPTR
eukprot:7299820-Prymnesium_polylepis.1